MRPQFGLRTLLLLFVAAAFCLFLFRNGCESWDINRARLEMPRDGFSFRYKQHGNGLLYTMVTSGEPILGIRVLVRDNQNRTHYDSGRIGVDSLYLLRFLVQQEQSPADPGDADYLKILLPPTIQGAKYRILGPTIMSGFGYASEGCTTGEILDEQRRHYDVWIMLERPPKAE
jgi:hypothetical protein